MLKVRLLKEIQNEIHFQLIQNVPKVKVYFATGKASWVFQIIFISGCSQQKTIHAFLIILFLNIPYWERAFIVK